nr:MAG TPA: hypothetical protein [Caudoviricetes sp.]
MVFFRQLLYPCLLYSIQLFPESILQFHHQYLD